MVIFHSYVAVYPRVFPVENTISIVLRSGLRMRFWLLASRWMMCVQVSDKNGLKASTRYYKICRSLLFTFNYHFQLSTIIANQSIYIYADWDVWSLPRFPVRTLWFQQCRPRCPGLGTGAGHMAEMGENSERRFHGTWILVTGWSIYVSWYFLVKCPASIENGAWTPPIQIGREREIYNEQDVKIRIQSLRLNKFPDGGDQGTQCGCAIVPRLPRSHRWRSGCSLRKPFWGNIAAWKHGRQNKTKGENEALRVELQQLTAESESPMMCASMFSSIFGI